MSRRRPINIWVFIGVGAVLALFVGAMLYSGSAYAGGWEVQTDVSKVIIDGEAQSYSGLHSVTKDIDSNFMTAVDAQGSYQDINPSLYNDPDIYIHTSYPFYLKPGAAGWVQSDSPYLFDSYDRDISGTEMNRYNHYVFGYDITIQTKATDYHKPFGSYIDYGYFYEANTVDVAARTDFTINPWVPAGTVDDVWNVVGGWAGIMSASCVEVESGLVQSGVAENYEHVITGLNSRGDALNMYGGVVADFENPSAIAGVPQTISIENHATLQAGAEYTTDVLGHWDSIAVRNVYVKYRVRVDVVTVLQFELEVGAPEEQEPPTEDITAYQPEITPWTDFLEALGGIGDWFANLGLPMIIVIVVAVVIIVVVIYVVRPILSMRGRAKGG